MLRGWGKLRRAFPGPTCPAGPSKRAQRDARGHRPGMVETPLSFAAKTMLPLAREEPLPPSLRSTPPHPPPPPTPPPHPRCCRDGCFISRGYDATSHFETEIEDVLDLYLRITGKQLDLSSESLAKRQETRE